MHSTLSLIAATTTTVAGSKKSTSSSLPLLFIIVAFAAAYFLFIRPRQQKMRQQQVASRQLEIGDDVVTAGGIHGRLVALGDDTAEVEVSPGVVLTFLRRAVNARPAPAGTTSTASPGDEYDSDYDSDAGEGHLDPPPQGGESPPDETSGPAA
jgi:preprotein translocase subunit YajC